MADVEMSDAPAGSKAEGSKAVEGKKKFEVKKVSLLQLLGNAATLLTRAVECRCALGLGHCG